MSRADAKRRIDAFERSRGVPMLRLAGHAALPAVIDASLLHLLRVNYFLDPPDTLPYSAETRLLLSPLCTEIGDGLYVIGPDERDILLQKLATDYGGARLRDVARLLWEYCERGTPWLARPGLSEAQQLTALNFIDSGRAREWLDRAERECAGRGGVADERWFVAMRKDLVRRNAAVQEAQADAETSAGLSPALIELRDALQELHGEPSATEQLARAAGVEFRAATTTHSASRNLLRLLEVASSAGRMGCRPYWRRRRKTMPTIRPSRMRSGNTGSVSASRCGSKTVVSKSRNPNGRSWNRSATRSRHLSGPCACSRRRRERSRSLEWDS